MTAKRKYFNGKFIIDKLLTSNVLFNTLAQWDVSTVRIC
jgi:hypothetical protein